MMRYPWVTTRDMRGNVVVPVEDAEAEADRLRAENADLKARLKAARFAVECAYNRGTDPREEVDRATDLRVKRWRK